MVADGLAAIIHRLSAMPNREGVVDAIHSLLLVAELEVVEREWEEVLYVVGEGRPLWRRTFMEWTPEGWREIR